MSDLPTLTEANVRAWLGRGEIDKGRPYAQRGLRDLRTEGRHLKGSCQGSAPQPYRVDIALNGDLPNKIESGTCSCPVGAGGRCKHAAALLLTWLGAPETFTEMATLEARLREKSHEELVTLISKMVDRHPDLETLVAMPTPGEPLDPNLIRRQVLSALERSEHDDYGYDDYGTGLSTGAQRDLLELVDLADRTLAQGDVESAAVTYKTMTGELLEHYEAYDDEAGSLAEVIDRCAEGLASLLAAVDSTTEAEEALREEALRTLFDIYHHDIRLGGVGLGDTVPEMITHYATPDERRRVAGWVREVLPEERSWSREALGRFLLELEADTLDDEAFLRVCRETGRTDDLVERLLLLNRVDEAVSEAAGASDYELLNLADTFVTHAQGAAIHPVIEARASNSKEGRLTTWLRDWARSHGDTARALELSETLFWERPSLSAYQDLKRDAEGAARWRTLHIGLLKKLEKGEQHSLLTEIYLLEHNVTSALKSVAKIRGWGSTSLSLSVAKAAEATHPREAVRLYEGRINALVGARGRENYAEAARLLERVRGLYEGVEEREAWLETLSEVKNQQPRLPALLDELKKAGL